MPAESQVTREEAWTSIALAAGWTLEQVQLQPSIAIRRAKRFSHPDSPGGSDRAFVVVTAAAEALGF